MTLDREYNLLMGHFYASKVWDLIYAIHKHMKNMASFPVREGINPVLFSGATNHLPRTPSQHSHAAPNKIPIFRINRTKTAGVGEQRIPVLLNYIDRLNTYHPTGSWFRHNAPLRGDMLPSCAPLLRSLQ